MSRLPDFVTTERLTLRTWTPDDAEALGLAITASVDHLRPWMPWASSEPLTLDDRRELIAGWDRDWREGRDVVLGIFLDGAVVGGCGLHRRRGPSSLEIGYWVRADRVRRGIAREATAALTEVAFTVDGIERVEVHHDRANLASRGVPRSLGFELAGETVDSVTSPGEAGIDCRWVMTKDRWQELTGRSA